MLSINDVTLGYGKKPVLHMGTVQIGKRGQCMVEGPSGSGKTTLLYTMAGLLTPVSGSIEIDGTDIYKLSEPERDQFRSRHIGIIFQTLHLVRSLSVLDNLLLAYYAAGLKQDKMRALHMLHRLGIEDKKDALPEQLSQGQAQRVAIARAVLLKPSVILADEPTSSLDDKSCNRVIEILLQVAKEAGSALLISTHDTRIRKHFSQFISFEEGK